MLGRELYKVLRHPMRERIILLLHDRGRMSYSELRGELNVEPGKLYYHLSVLKDLVGQDEDKRYFLTDLGVKAYMLLTSSELPDEFVSPMVGGRFLTFITGEPLLRYLYVSPHRHLVEGLLVVLLGSWLISTLKYGSLPLFILKYSFKEIFPLQFLPFKGSMLAGFEFILSFLILYGSSILLSALLFRRGGGNLSLFVGVSISQIPIILYILLQLLFNYLSLNPPYYLDNLLFIFMQGWSISILSSAIALSKNLRLWKAFLIVLIIIYINILYILLFITGI